jgi:hypothetical protein
VNVEQHAVAQDLIGAGLVGLAALLAADIGTRRSVEDKVTVERLCAVVEQDFQHVRRIGVVAGGAERSRACRAVSAGSMDM